MPNLIRSYSANNLNINICQTIILKSKNTFLYTWVIQILLFFIAWFNNSLNFGFRRITSLYLVISGNIAIQRVASLASPFFLDLCRLLTLEMQRPWDVNILSLSCASVVCSAGGWRNAWRAVGRRAIKFYYQIKPHSQENASLLGVPPKQYLQVLHLSKLRRRAAMNFPCIDLKLYSYISGLMWRKISRSLE